MVPIGLGVSEELMKMWKVNGRTPSDDKSSHGLWAGGHNFFNWHGYLSRCIVVVISWCLVVNLAGAKVIFQENQRWNIPEGVFFPVFQLFLPFLMQPIMKQWIITWSFRRNTITDRFRTAEIYFHLLFCIH